VAFLSPQRVILYGSRARGDSVPKSDIDLAVAASPGASRNRAHFDRKDCGQRAGRRSRRPRSGR
jgi:predicted nucleotidyltransferase